MSKRIIVKRILVQYSGSIQLYFVSISFIMILETVIESDPQTVCLSVFYQQQCSPWYCRVFIKYYEPKHFARCPLKWSVTKCCCYNKISSTSDCETFSSQKAECMITHTCLQDVLERQFCSKKLMYTKGGRSRFIRCYFFFIAVWVP